MPNAGGSSDDGPSRSPMSGRGTGDYVAPQKYPMRPLAGRKYPMRPIGRKYPMRPYDPRGEWPPPQPGKYPMRPYDWRKYPMRPYDEPSMLDPDEWSADVSDLFCCSSAVVRLGARLVHDGDVLPVPDVPLLGPVYQAPGLRKPVVAPTVQVLRPGSHELSVAVDVPTQLAQDLTDRPDVAWAMKEDVANALALAADGAFLNGPGLPGITGVSAAAPQTGAAADVLATARDMVQELRGAGVNNPAPAPLVPVRNAGWVLHPAALDALASLQTATGITAGGGGRGPRALDDTDLLIYDGRDGGELLGYPYVLSEGAGAAPNGMFLSVDWGEAWIGVEQDIVRVDFATDAGFGTNRMTVRATMYHDFVVRRVQAFRWTP